MNRNIARLLPEMALKYPDKMAVLKPDGKTREGHPAYTSLTYLQLENLSNTYAIRFSENGITKGIKTFILLRPGLDFIAVAFAVFKTGAIPVLIDPGMGKKNLLSCIGDTAPQAMIAVSMAHWIKTFCRSPFKSVKTSISAGAFPPIGVLKLEKFAKSFTAGKNVKFESAEMTDSDPAAILFTTGSTGAPKGVLYTHGIFNAQVELISETYGTGPGEVDMSAFALFALFASSMGMPSIIPDMDFTRPAQADPQKIIETVLNNNVSFSFGSPALWRNTAAYCIEKEIKLSSLKKVLMAGAPVTEKVHRLVKSVIADDGETLVPYGATEALPVSNFTGTEMLNETAALTAEGRGYCVGYPLRGITVKIIRCVEEAIPEWKDDYILPGDEIGEIVVKGPVVSPEYYNRPEATRAAKIKDADGTLWHRMGDMGYIDSKGRIWFCGRKAHRVVTEQRIYYSVCCEAIFNHHPKVFRTALVGVGKGKSRRPVLIVETLPREIPCDEKSRKKFSQELAELGKKSELTCEIKDFLFHPSFPVDIRHNAKIFREKLALWADETLKEKPC
ncbi:MAG: hypothetical protein A2020_05690 [Lentisphaerae bacterium GWF2_45_14]|nr:MAG: hypothetical protein A2020_05690 [Lentisphaerae bacterium GWF2_45_14]